MAEFSGISGGEGSLVRTSIGGYAVPLPEKGVKRALILSRLDALVDVIVRHSQWE